LSFGTPIEAAVLLPGALDQQMEVHREQVWDSGTICKGVSNPQTSNALSGCENEEIPK